MPEIKDRDLLDAIKGKQKNPRVGIRRKDMEGLVIRVGFKHLTEEDRAVILRWYRSGYFTQKQLAKMFDISVGIINKAVRAFVVSARNARKTYAKG